MNGTSAAAAGQSAGPGAPTQRVGGMQRRRRPRALPACDSA